MWTISGFADEVSDDFQQQLTHLLDLGVRFIDLRSVSGIRVLDLSDAQLRRVRAMLDEAGVAVACLATDLGKIGINDDFAPHLDRVRRAVEVAWFLETSDLRGFSFFIPDGDDPAAHRAQVIDRLGEMVDLTLEAGLRYLHENEKQIYGDLPQRCLELADQLDPDGFRLIFDPANYVQCGVRPVDEAYPIVREATVHVHIKDADAADGSVRPAGQGDGQLPELIRALLADDYDGFLSLEPHLGSHHAFGGSSGPELWTSAHRALVDLLRAESIDFA